MLYPLAGELIVNLAVGQQLRPKNITVINAPSVLSNTASQFNSKLLIQTLSLSLTLHFLYSTQPGSYPGPFPLTGPRKNLSAAETEIGHF